MLPEVLFITIPCCLS